MGAGYVWGGGRGAMEAAAEVALEVEDDERAKGRLLSAERADGMELEWRLCEWRELSSVEAYAVAQLRVDVFVVEQQCVYSEFDGQDLITGALHLLALKPSDASVAGRPPQLAAYLRILPPKDTAKVGAPGRLGRIIVHPGFRGSNLGTELVRRGVEACEAQYNTKTVAISAQAHLAKFYARNGFCAIGEGYLEDGIPHIAMIRSTA